MAKILITGGAGFIGSHLAETLVSENHEIIVIDNLFHGKEENLSSISDKVSLVNADLSDTKMLSSVLSGKDYVFHTAANTSVNKSLECPGWSCEQNIQNTVSLLECAVKVKIKRVIFSSSAAVYGLHASLPNKETEIVTPGSPYALEKLTCENYLRLFSSLHDMDTVALRYFNVYGPRQYDDFPHPGGVTIVIRQVLETGKSQLMGEGKQTRDMIYVGDVVQASLLAMKSGIQFSGKVYNVCTGKSIVISEMHDKISELMGAGKEREYIPFPEGNIVDSVGDNTAIRRDMDFTVQTSLEEGLQKTIKGYMKEWKSKNS
jgi:UDP-glucose 4-epimerase